MTTLGVDLAPDGNLLQQAEKMRRASILWADQMRTGRLSRSDYWIALHSTLWKSLEYPLPALNLSKKQCEKIMAPALHQFLPFIGVCHNFPWDLVHTPLKYGGLGITHIHTTQEIMRLTNMIYHTAYKTDTGNLYLASMANMILESGLGETLFSLPYSELCFLTTNSLVKSTWQFLDSNSIVLNHDNKVPKYRENDTAIMKILYDSGVRDIELFILNKCRLYLNVYNLSAIYNMSGSEIKKHILQGMRGPKINDFVWPKQGNPTNSDWEIWRTIIRKVFNHDNILLTKLGPWIHNESSIWYFSPEEECLYKKEPQSWLKFCPVKRRTRDTYYELVGTSAPSTMIYSVHTYLIMVRALYRMDGTKYPMLQSL
jgi:hypothetical protein